MSETLFDKYGGFDTFSAVVTNFYQKVLDSDQIKHYFEGVNMEGLISHQTNFLAKVLGGPDKYEGRDLKAVHAKFKITVEDFTEVAELLEESLDEAGVEEADIATIISVVASIKDDIVSA